MRVGSHMVNFPSITWFYPVHQFDNSPSFNCLVLSFESTLSCVLKMQYPMVSVVRNAFV